MYYNTNLTVKYFTIQTELLKKYHNKPAPNISNNTTNDPDDSDYDYNEEDIYDICNKLYRDELQTALFNDDEFSSAQLNIRMTMLLKELKQYSIFKTFLESLRHKIWQQTYDNATQLDDQYVQAFNENTDFLIFAILFSNELFYLTHQAVCELLTANKIDLALLHTLRERAETIISQQVQLA